MILWLVLSANAAQPAVVDNNAYSDTTDWAAIRSDLALHCDSAKTAAAAAQMMGVTTGQAQKMMEQLPVLSAGINHYPAMLALERPGQLSAQDWQGILAGTSKIHDATVGSFNSLSARIDASQTAITLLRSYPPRRLRRHERKAVTDLCVHDQLLTLSSMVFTVVASYQALSDLHALRSQAAAGTQPQL